MKIKIEWLDGTTNTISAGNRLGHAIIDGIAQTRPHTYITVKAIDGKNYKIVSPNPSGSQYSMWEEIKEEAAQ